MTVADSGGHRRAVSATSLGILASRILGYVRDGVIMAVFGAGPITDAYLVAFLIPNLFRRLAGEGALSASFIPIFARKDRSSREDAEAFAGSAVSYVFTIVSLFCLVAALTSSVFVSVFAPGLRQSPEIYHLSSRLLSALFPYLLLMSLYALFSGMLNTRDRFGIPAAASALENAAVIAAAFFLVPALGDKPEDRIWGLVAGVLVGGVLQVGWVWLALRGTGFRLRPSFERTPELMEMLGLMLPAAFTLAIYQLNNIVNQGIASFLPSGTITSLYLAYRLIEFPSALFGTAVGTVTLPKAAQAGTDVEYRAVLNRSVGLCLLWMIPSMVAYMAFSEPLIILLFQYGNFSMENAGEVSRILRVYAPALPFIGIGRILGAACYASKAPRVPLTSGGIAVISNAAVSILLVLILPPAYQSCGIALGLTVGTMMNVFMLIRLSGPRDVLRGFRLRDYASQAAVNILSALVFGIPLFFLTARLLETPPPVLRIGAALAVFISMGVYFGLLKIHRIQKVDRQ